VVKIVRMCVCGKGKGKERMRVRELIYQSKAPFAVTSPTSQDNVKRIEKGSVCLRACWYLVSRLYSSPPLVLGRPAGREWGGGNDAQEARMLYGQRQTITRHGLLDIRKSTRKRRRGN